VLGASGYAAPGSQASPRAPCGSRPFGDAPLRGQKDSRVPLSYIQIMEGSSLSAPGVDWQAFNQTLGRLAIEFTESAVLGCFEPKPISSCYDDELPRVRRKILEARNGRLARFRDQVNGNALLIGCLEYADDKPEEHLIIGYGFRHGSTTKSKACTT
jgi:hypothetical protein